MESKIRAVLDRLGVIPDAVLAREVDISRQTLATYRKMFHINQAPPAARAPRAIAADVRRRIEELLDLKAPLHQIRTQLHLSHATIKQVATDHGWTRVQRPPSDTVGSMLKSEVLELHRANTPHTEIARRAGVSHERIRQVVAKNNYDTRREIQHRERLAMERVQHEASARLTRDRICAKLSTMKARVAPAQELWIADAPTAAIARRYRISVEQLGQLILRARYTLGWFPRRYSTEGVRRTGCATVGPRTAPEPTTWPYPAPTQLTIQVVPEAESRAALQPLLDDRADVQVYSYRHATSARSSVTATVRYRFGATWYEASYTASRSSGHHRSARYHGPRVLHLGDLSIAVLTSADADTHDILQTITHRMSGQSIICIPCSPSSPQHPAIMAQNPTALVVCSHGAVGGTWTPPSFATTADAQAVGTLLTIRDLHAR